MPTTSSQKTVFILAEAATLRSFVGVLRRAGFRAIGVTDTKSARVVLESLSPDLVIAAYPGLDGEEADLTVILMDGGGSTRFPALALLHANDGRLAAAALADGFSDVCAQPVPASELLAKVRRLILSGEADPPLPSA